MSKRERRTEKTIFNQAQKSEDVERIKNILNRGIKKSNVKLGARAITKKNPFLKPDGSFDLIEKFPSYKDKKKRKAER